MNQSRKEGSSSCQCTMTLIGQNEEIKKHVLRMLSELLSMLEDSRKDIGRSYGTEPMPTNRMENGIQLLKARCSILYFVPALERGELKSKGQGVKTIHFNDTIESIHRTIISVNQLSIYGAVADLCKELETHQVQLEFGIDGDTDRISCC